MGQLSWCLGSRQAAFLRAFVLENDEKLIRELVLQLKTGRVEKQYFAEKFGVDIAQRFAEPITTLSKQGFLVQRNGTLAVTSKGLLQIDKELPEFFLAKHRGVRYT